MGKMSESVFQVQPKTEFLMYFWWGPLGGLGDRGPAKKETRQTAFYKAFLDITGGLVNGNSHSLNPSLKKLCHLSFTVDLQRRWSCLTFQISAVVNNWFDMLYWLQATMLEVLPGLINAVRMIYSISSYYNTPGRMTSLFVKVVSCLRQL